MSSTEASSTEASNAEATATAERDILLRYLRSAREALLWKLDGLSEYDVRRPLTPTGTNLLGLIKHVASTEYGYLSECFGRDAGIKTPWLDDDAPDNADMWATATESREFILQLAHDAWAADDAAVHELGLDAVGTVPWWGDEGRRIPMRRLIVHMIAETNRHAGHADILREMIDGDVGLRPAAANVPSGDAEWWQEYVATVEAAAVEAAGSCDSQARAG